MEDDAERLERIMKAFNPEGYEEYYHTTNTKEAQDILASTIFRMESAIGDYVRAFGYLEKAKEGMDLLERSDPLLREILAPFIDQLKQASARLREAMAERQHEDILNRSHELFKLLPK